MSLKLAYSTSTAAAHRRTWDPFERDIAAIAQRHPNATAYQICLHLGWYDVPFRLVESVVRDLREAQNAPARQPVTRRTTTAHQIAA